MQDLLQAFIAQYTGVSGVGDTPENKGQCVGLVEVWINSLNLPHVWGNAKDLLANADSSKFDIVYKSPSNIPVPGAIMVWNIGQYGHTGLFVSGDVNKFTSFDQNWPTGHAPQLVEHDYTGVIGWLVPKVQPTQATGCLVPNTPEWQQKYQELVSGCSNWEQVVKLGYYSIAQLSQTLDKIPNLELQLSQASDKITTLSGEVNDYKTKYEDEQRHTIELNGQMADIASALEKVKTESKDYGIQILDEQHKSDNLTHNLQDLYKSLNACTQEEALASIQSLREPHDEVVKAFSTLYDLVFNEKNNYVQRFLQMVAKSPNIFQKLLSFIKGVKLWNLKK